MIRETIAVVFTYLVDLSVGRLKTFLQAEISDGDCCSQG